MRKQGLGFLLLGAGTVFFAAACSDGGSASAKAVEKRDYHKAFPLCLHLAKQGDLGAQNDVGLMYEQGKGVAKDHMRALDWYRRSAEGGYSVAQNNLGSMYEKGQGARKDNVQAGKWYIIAAAQGNIEGFKKLALLRDKVSQSQLEESQKLAQSWMQKHQ